MSSDLAFGSRGGSFAFCFCFCFAVGLFRALLDCLFFFEDVGGACAFFRFDFPFLFFGFFPRYLDFFGLGPPPIRLTGRST